MWLEFIKTYRACEKCKKESLSDRNSFPIFTKHTPKSFDILFILEAPNRDDTYNPKKGYLTVDELTDPSGRFFHDLYTNELQFSMDDLFITNSVLCLPAERSGKYPVSSLQRTKCLPVLKHLIDEFNPLIVCPLGTKALLALDNICKHGLKLMKSAAAIPCPWHRRILFPLYHTSLLARNPLYGRTEPQQRSDWRKLRAVWEQTIAEHNK